MSFRALRPVLRKWMRRSARGRRVIGKWDNFEINRFHFTPQMGTRYQKNRKVSDVEWHSVWHLPCGSAELLMTT